MTTEFKTEKGSYLLVKVPSESRDHWIVNNNTANVRLNYYRDDKEFDGNTMSASVDLPGIETYSILGLVSELTEEVWREVVDEPISHDIYKSYYQYLFKDHVLGLTVQESAKSLLYSLNAQTGSWLLLKKDLSI